MSIKALYLNTSLKTGEDTSNTEALMQKSMDILENESVETELIRIADYNIIPGMSADMGGGDEWPEIFRKINDSDIIVIGTPIWNGHKSSLATTVMERIYAQSSETAENGQSKYYNKVFGTVVTGNEDGAKKQVVQFSLVRQTPVLRPRPIQMHTGAVKPGPVHLI